MNLSRRLDTAPALVGAVVLVVEVALIGYWITSGATAVVVIMQLLVVAAIVLVALAVRYRRIRDAFHEATISDAASRERERIAAEMHDTLGHQLSLIALRAGTLQIGSHESVATQAAAIRREADEATAQLHAIIGVMRSNGPFSVTGVIERARDAGVDVRVRGTLPAVTHPDTMAHLHRVAREGITNAVKHAPGQRVDVEFSADGSCVSMSISTPRIAGDRRPDSPRQSGGLRILGDRLSAAGGSLSAVDGPDVFVLTATVPFAPRAAADIAVKSHRPVRTLLLQAAVPLTTAAAIVIAFYATASRHAVMEQDTFDAVDVGAPAVAVDRSLPTRQAPVRLIHVDSHPATWHCRYYTDGNFPLAMATYEICMANGFVTRTTDLRRRPWN